MKKRIFTLLLAVTMLAAMLAACGGGTTTVAPTRGSWDGNVFTSEYLGLRFVTPPGWNVMSDAEIGATMGLATGFMESFEVEMPDDAEMAHDMMAVNPLTGDNVQIIYERIQGRRIPTVAQIIEASTEPIEQMGGRVISIPGTTRIGAHTWYSFGTEINMGGMIAYGRQFVNIQDGFVRLIIITNFTSVDAANDILPMFIGMNDPIPEPPAIERAPELVGTWAWDESEDYTYIFHDDGTGLRGVYPLQYEEFEWQTEGDDHLMLDMGPMVESWTFTITGDVLTIDSRQVAGWTFSYIRVNG